MLHVLIGVLGLIALIALVAWLSRTDDSSSINGGNRDAASRYGPGSGL